MNKRLEDAIHYLNVCNAYRQVEIEEVITELQIMLTKYYDEEVTEVINNCDNRNFKDYWCKNWLEFLEWAYPEWDYETTIWEQWYLRGIEVCKNLLSKKYEWWSI